MSESFGRWESDPLFYAAEVVQDSADRMESALRMWSHEQRLAQGDPSDPKLLSLMNYHKRDLATAVETTKWQLEDFEGAVNFAAISDKSNSRKNAILKHRQFIRAIKEQVVQVEKNLQDLSKDEFCPDSQLPTANEQNTDVLALFLSGGESRDLHCDSGNSTMRRFLDSATDSDEIVELKTEAEPFAVNGLKNPDHGYTCSKDHMSWNTGAQYSEIYGIDSPTFFRSSSGLKECEESRAAYVAYDLESGDSSAKFYAFRNRLMESVLWLLRNFRLSNKNRESFTKRRKDGDVSDNLIEDDDPRRSSSDIEIPPPGKGLNIEGLINAFRFYSWLEAIERRMQRSRRFILYNRVPMRLCCILPYIKSMMPMLLLCLASSIRKVRQQVQLYCITTTSQCRQLWVRTQLPGLTTFRWFSCSCPDRSSQKKYWPWLSRAAALLLNQ